MRACEDMEMDNLLEGFDVKARFPEPVVAVHSARGATATLQDKTQQKNSSRSLYIVFHSQKMGVTHASLVLAEPMHALDAAEGKAPLASANPLFSEMMTAITDVEKQHE